MNFTMLKRHESLCHRCMKGTIATSASGAEVIHCNEFCSAVRQPHQPVKHCTAYEFRFGEATHDMKQQAWIIEVGKRSEFIGFKAPKRGNGGD